MSSVEQGTQVRVVIEGVVDRTSGWITVRSSESGCEWDFDHDEPAVQVVPIEPDRPTLDRETLLATIRQATNPAARMHNGDISAGFVTDTVLALIEAAHPGLIR